MSDKPLVKTFSAFDEDPNLPEIVEFVSNGGSLFQYCKHNNLPFGATRRWVYTDDNRRMAYEDALAAHEDWANQALAHLILQVMSFDPSTVYDDTGRMLPVSEWPEAARFALTGIKSDGKTGQLTEAKFAAKLDAVKVLGTSTAFAARKPRNEPKAKKSLEDILSEIESEESDE